MDLWQESIARVLDANSETTLYFTGHKRQYEELLPNLKRFNESLAPEIYVPICKRVFMKGNLIHTNELLVYLGFQFYIKTTSSKAQDICKRRLENCNVALRKLDSEYEYLLSQVKAGEYIFREFRDEILEKYDEEEEKAWRIEHRRKVAEHRRAENEEMRSMNSEAFTTKLDILELQEDMSTIELTNDAAESDKNYLERAARIQFLQEKLLEFRQREKPKCVTEDDIIKRLDELQEEEDLEDDLERLNGNSNCGSDVSDEHTESEDEVIEHEVEEKQETLVPLPIADATEKDKADNPDTRRVTFAQEIEYQSQLIDDAKTININFTHTSTATTAKKNPTVLECPSDIYHLFPKTAKKTKSAIKNCHKVDREKRSHHQSNPKKGKPTTSTQTIVIGDVVEHVSIPSATPVSNKEEFSRRISLFKSSRLGKKKSQKTSK